METFVLRVALTVALLAGLVPPFSAADSTADSTGVGGNIAGSTLTIPTMKPVPYNQSCSVGSYIFNGTELGVYCNTDDYTNWYYDWTSINLDACVGNRAGTLVPYPDGNFSLSCGGCDVSWSHVLLDAYSTTYLFGYDSRAASSITTLFTPRWDDLYLSCTGCNAGFGITVLPSQFNLNQVLVNNDGTIGCFGNNGSTGLAQPAAERATAPRAVFALPTSTPRQRGAVPTA